MTSNLNSRFVTVAVAVVSAAWCALLCFLSLLIVSDRDPWTAVAASILPILLVPTAIVSWWLPKMAVAIGFLILVFSDVLCASPNLSWQSIAGCAVHFTGWGYVSLLCMAASCLFHSSKLSNAEI